MQTDPTGNSLSLFDFLLSGGLVGNIILLVLFAMSLIAVSIFIEKYIQIRISGKIDKKFQEEITEMLKSGEIDKARNLCKSNKTVLAIMLDRALSKSTASVQDLQITVENTGKLEISKLENQLSNLATIAGGAPMIGFLGTVIGMIMAFYNISSSGGDVRIETLSQGIYTAMVTTAAGLVVGIFAYFAYNFLVSRVGKVVTNLETEIFEFLDIITGQNG